MTENALLRAKRPLILAGHGVRCANSVQKFRYVIKDMHIPVVTTQLARDLMPHDDPFYIGTPGVKGDRAGGFAVQNADVIVIIGCSLHPTTTGYELDKFAPQAFKIHIDIDDAVLRKTKTIVQHQVQMSVQNFVKNFRQSSDFFLKSLTFNISTEGIYNAQKRIWHKQCLAWKEKYPCKPQVFPDDRIDYYHVIDALSDLADENDTIIADAGSAFYVVGQAWRTKKNQRVILPGGLAQMGYATSAAIGAGFANPNGRVIVITGDGSLQTNIHDLAVIAHHDLNVKIFVMNNNGYACIRNTQDSYFGGFHSGVDQETGVFIPLICELCATYGITYESNSWRNLDTLLPLIFTYQNAVLCEIRTEDNQQFYPRVQSTKREDGTMASGSLDRMFPYLD